MNQKIQLRHVIHALIACITSFFGCTSENSSKKQTSAITISVNETSESHSITEYLQSVELVPLETTNESIIASISKVRVTKNKILIFDRGSGKVLAFDKAGNYLFQYGKKGKGPGEYENLLDFDFDIKSNEVLLLSSDKMSLLKFQLNGLFIDRIPLDFPFYRFSVIDEGYSFFVGYFDEEYVNLRVTDKQGSMLRSSFSFPNDLNPMVFQYTGTIVNGPNNSLYADATSPYLYEISKNEDVLKYKLEFGNTTWPHDNRHEFQQFLREINDFKLTFLNSNFYENENALTFLYTDKNKRMRAFYLKKSDQLVRLEDLHEDWITSSLSVPVGWSVDGRFVSIINQIELENYLQKEKIQLPENYDLLNEISLEDNPAVMIYNLGL